MTVINGNDLYDKLVGKLSVSNEEYSLGDEDDKALATALHRELTDTYKFPLSESEAQSIVDLARQIVGSSASEEEILEKILELIGVENAELAQEKGADEESDISDLRGKDMTALITEAITEIAGENGLDANDSEMVKNIAELLNITEEEAQFLMGFANGDIERFMKLAFDVNKDETISFDEVTGGVRKNITTFNDFSNDFITQFADGEGIVGEDPATGFAPIIEFLQTSDQFPEFADLSEAEILEVLSNLSIGLIDKDGKVTEGAIELLVNYLGNYLLMEQNGELSPLEGFTKSAEEVQRIILADQYDALEENARTQALQEQVRSLNSLLNDASRGITSAVKTGQRLAKGIGDLAPKPDKKPGSSSAISRG